MSKAGLAQATTILDLVTMRGGQVGLAEIETRTALRPAAMMRLLAAMEDEGWLVRTGDSYFYGPKIIDWGISSICPDGLVERATPVIEALFDRTGVDIGLAVFSAPNIVFVNTFGLTHDPSAPRIGIPYPAHFMGNGRAILATYPEEYLSAYVRKYLSDLSQEEIRDRVTGPIRDTRSRGYGLTGADKIGTAHAISLPLFNVNSVAIASLNLWQPDRRGNSDTSELEAMLPALRHAADQISQNLGLLATRNVA